MEKTKNAHLIFKEDIIFNTKGEEIKLHYDFLILNLRQ